MVSLGASALVMKDRGSQERKRTLAGNLDIVTNADSLAVPQLFTLGLTEARVAVALKVSHNVLG